MILKVQIKSKLIPLTENKGAESIIQITIIIIIIVKKKKNVWPDNQPSVFSFIKFRAALHLQPPASCFSEAPDPVEKQVLRTSISSDNNGSSPEFR